MNSKHNITLLEQLLIEVSYTITNLEESLKLDDGFESLSLETKHCLHNVLVANQSIQAHLKEASNEQKENVHGVRGASDETQETSKSAIKNAQITPFMLGEFWPCWPID